MKTLTKQTLLMIALSVAFLAKAQDVMIKRTGDEIKAKITEIGTETVKYKKWEKQDGPDYVIKKSEVFMIKYEDGTKDVFNQSKSEEIKSEIPPESIQDICQKGKNDASLNYKAGDPGAGTAVATILFSPVGLIVAIGASSTPPADMRLRAPDLKLLSNSNYKACYKNEAHRMKRRNVWGAYCAVGEIAALN